MTAPSFENLQMGPCSITFKGTDLGLTMGGVEVAFTTEVTDIVADQFGAAVIDQVIKSRGIKVKVPLAEFDLDKFATIFPGTTLVGTTTKKLVFKSAVGTSLRALAGNLTLHPYALDASNKEFDLNIMSAMCQGAFTYVYKNDTQRVYAVEFTGYVDMTTQDMFSFGDPAAA